MSSLQFVSTKAAPPPAAPYSQAVKANGTLYISGQVPLTAEGKMVESDDIKVLAKQCFDNISAILAEAGSSVPQIIKLGIFTTDIKHFAAVNEVYIKFVGEHRPARTFVAVKQLPLNADVEIECIAAY